MKRTTRWSCSWVVLVASCIVVPTAGAVFIGNIQNGADFPAGAASFADAVASYDPVVIAGGPTDPHRVAANALGVLDYAGEDDCCGDPGCSFVSLGDGGSITFRLLDNTLTGSGSADPDLFTWARLTDDGALDAQSGRPVGADIDAVGAISTALLPEPFALVLVGLGLAGPGFARRRRWRWPLRGRKSACERGITRHLRFRARTGWSAVGMAVGLVTAPVQGVLGAMPTLAPGIGTLELVATDPVLLNEIDGLAFDDLGNLFGALEINDPGGGVVHIDKNSGAVTVLATGISRADQIAFDPVSRDFFVTSEESAGSATAQRIYRVTPAYVGGVPVAAGTIVTNVTTTLEINEPEGLVVIEHDGSGFGAAGDLIVAEDLDPGRILHLTPAGAVTMPALVPASMGLRRPEGLALGDFNGALTEALYAAETRNHRIVRIEPDGSISVFGDPAAVGLVWPDNVEFGPDGFLYTSEDAIGTLGRIIRIAADGTHSVFAEGFNAPQGLVFDPFSGDLYLSEQGTNSVYRVRFAVVPLPASLPLLVSALAVASWHRRSRRTRQ